MSASLHLHSDHSALHPSGVSKSSTGLPVVKVGHVHLCRVAVSGGR